MNWLTRPIELPPGVQRLLPKSGVRAIAAAGVIALWLRPNLDVSGFSGYPRHEVAGWQLWGIFPANLTVPLTALILLMCAWRGCRRIEILSVLVLWLHAVVIAILVPLGMVMGGGGIVLTLYVAMVSGLGSLLVAPPSIGGVQSNEGDQTSDSAQARNSAPSSARLLSEVRRVIIMGCGVGMLAVVLLFPVFISQAARSRESNLLYAGLMHVVESMSGAGRTRASSDLPGPVVVQQPSEHDAKRVPIPAPPLLANQEEQTGVAVAKRCRLGGGQISDPLASSLLTQAAQEAWVGWREVLTAPSIGKKQLANARQRLFQALVDKQLNPSSSGWLSLALPSLQNAAVESGMFTTMLPWDADLSAPPDIGWTRPIIAEGLARYSEKRAETKVPPTAAPVDRPLSDAAVAVSVAHAKPTAATAVSVDQVLSDSAAAAAAAVDESESEESESEPEDHRTVRVFPFDFACSTAGSLAEDPGVWVYPMAGTTAAVPQLETHQKDGQVLLKLPVASVQRVASIVDFARFIDAEVSVTLAHREVSEASPGEPDESWPGLSWGIEVTTDLPVLVVAGDKLVPGRLVHAHGDDPCLADSSIDIVVGGSPGAPVTGFLLLQDDSLAERVTVLSVQSKQKTHDELRSSRTEMLVDVTGDHGADFSFQSVRYEVRAPAENGDTPWTTGPWSWVGAASSDEGATPYDRVTYPGCERR